MGHIAVALLLTAVGALPPPPQYIELPTRMFGTVMVPHAHHLALRVSCVRCHPPGPISKFAPLGPEYGHARCYTCHSERLVGPTECRGCHQGLPPKKANRPPALARTGGWRELAWCMTSAEVHAALLRMRAPSNGVFSPVDAADERRGTKDFEVALDEPVSPTATAAQARLRFRNDTLRGILLRLAAADPRESYRELLVEFTTRYGEPTLADPPSEFWWLFDDTSLLLLPAIPGVAPVEIWYLDRLAGKNCAGSEPGGDQPELTPVARRSAGPADSAAPAQSSPTANQ
jgi:hypothetical protein